MKNDLILTSLSSDELRELISEAIQKNLPSPQPKQDSKVEEAILSRQELKEMLGISFVSIHKFMKSGKLKYMTFGRRTFFNLSDVKKFMNSGCDISN